MFWTKQIFKFVDSGKKKHKIFFHESIELNFEIKLILVNV